MKILLPWLIVLLAAPVQGQDLQLYVIPDTPAHMEAWHTVEAAARRAGIRVTMRILPAERGMVMANQGELDGAIGRTTLAARAYPDLVQVPEAVFQYAPTAYSYKQLDVAAGWNAMRGHTLCVRSGYTLTETRTRGVPRRRFDNDASLLRMLRRGGCDIAIMDRRNQAAQAAMAADPDLHRLLPPLEEAPLFLFLHKRHAALVPRLAQALRAGR